MMKNNLILLLLSLPTISQAVIVESKNLNDIYTHLQKDSIVIFDIDNTMTKISPAIEPWVHSKTAKLEKKGLAHDEAFHFVLAMFFTITEITSLVPIGNAPAIVHDLQKKKFPVIALTNRSIPVAKRTIQRLKKINIDLSSNHISKNIMNLYDTHAALYSNGIIFTGSNDKGRMLFTFFDAIDYKPKHIIFLDDRQNNVESVDLACKQNNIECICLRVGLMDEVKKNFDHTQAEKIIYNLKQKLGFEPLIPIEKKETNWTEKIWNSICWPFKKLWNLL
ncbi:DUF2608 domain-containing protein [bacterium]|nr:DUF2608 domain-containing protein [bacterium]